MGAADPKPKAGAVPRPKGAEDDDGADSDRAGKAEAAGAALLPAAAAEDAKDVPNGAEAPFADDREEAGAEALARPGEDEAAVAGAEKESAGTEPPPADPELAPGEGADTADEAAAAAESPNAGGIPKGDDAGFGADREAAKEFPKPKAEGAAEP